MGTVQAEWCGMRIGVQLDGTEGVGGLSPLARAKVMRAVQQKAARGGQSVTLRALEPVSAEFSWQVAAASGTDVRELVRRWEAKVGEAGRLRVGGADFYDRDLLLAGFRTTDLRLDVSGRYLSATLTASFVEQTEERDAARDRKSGWPASEAARVRMGYASGVSIGPTRREKAAAAREGGGR